MNCIACGKPLSGGLDTFGEIGQELCQVDYLALLSEKPAPLPRVTWLAEDADEDDEDDVIGLEDGIASLEAEIDDLEDELEQRRRELERFQDRKDKPIREANEALEKWRTAVQS